MKWVAKIEENLVGIMLLSVTAVLFVNITLRFVFSNSFVWAEEFIRYGIIWITFIGVAVCFRRGMHVGIDFIFTILPHKGGRYLKLFITLLSMLFMGLLLKFGYDLVVFSFNANQMAAALGIQLAWVYLAIPIGAFLSLVHLVFVFIDLLKDNDTDEKPMEETTNYG
ncbi:TRAP transporter small permease [Natribacillus halophilus]|nr:TRAP transporter small permease [Natribacillus halophilus]